MPGTSNPIALAICLSGDAEGLLLEFEAALKSILCNAPFTQSLEVYIVADEPAAVAVGNLLEALQIDNRSWRAPLRLQILNIQALAAGWRGRVLATVPKIREIHTFGSYYRLFLCEVLAGRSHHVIYTDSDVVFLAPLSGLWAQRNEEAMVCWGERRCSGVTIINLESFQRDFWRLAADSVDREKVYSDQQLMRSIQERHPQRFSWLSPAWDVHLADGCWKYRDQLPEHIPAAGFLHFNGGGSSKEAYFKDDDTWAYRTRGWRLASYYIELPWSWLFYMGEVSAEETASGDRIMVAYEVL